MFDKYHVSYTNIFHVVFLELECTEQSTTKIAKYVEFQRTNICYCRVLGVLGIIDADETDWKVMMGN